jgi:hypothetical protein
VASVNKVEKSSQNSSAAKIKTVNFNLPSEEEKKSLKQKGGDEDGEIARMMQVGIESGISGDAYAEISQH